MRHWSRTLRNNIHGAKTLPPVAHSCISQETKRRSKTRYRKLNYVMLLKRPHTVLNLRHNKYGMNRSADARGTYFTNDNTAQMKTKGGNEKLVKIRTGAKQNIYGKKIPQGKTLSRKPSSPISILQPLTSLLPYIWTTIMAVRGLNNNNFHFYTYCL